MKPTSEQRAAIHIHDKNLIVVAGAGSGKTRVLVERYLRLLEVNPAWRLGALVAITFTREAAFEMRQRLREELEERAKTSPGGAWTRHLSQLASARIDTIHGLCADLLRANAAQAGIDPLFTVLDENESAILLDDIVQDLLATIEAPLSSLFANYDAFIIEGELRRLSLVNAEYPPAPDDPDELFRQWESEWSAEVNEARAGLLASAEASDVPQAGPAPHEDKLAALQAQYMQYLNRITVADGAAEITRLLQACVDKGAVGNKGSAKLWGGRDAKQEAAKALRDLRARMKEALTTIGEPPGDIDRRTADLLPLWRQLLGEVRTTYRARKRQNAQLDFDDLERLAAQLLQDKAVQARYRGREFKHLLVDEFQDTNAAQWAIIQALANLKLGGSLFVVGDPKQSIYQFRGADVSVFNRVRAQLAALDSGRELPLSTSFRSHRPLVAQLNALFATILVRAEESPVREYEVEFDKPMQAFRALPPRMPAIEVMLLDSAALDKKDDEKEDEKEDHDISRWEWEACEIAERIQRMIADERPVYDKRTGETRPMQYRDVAVLFQSLTRLPLYEEIFKSRETPFLTLSGRGYFDRQEVWDMLDLLRFLHNTADDLALATVLRSPIFAFSDDLLFALRLIRADDDEPIPLWRALHVAADEPPPGATEDDLPLVNHAMATLNSLLSVAGRVTISELLRRALAQTNYLPILTGLPDGDRRRGNVEKLLQLAADSGKISLSKFSRHLADLSAREAREGEAHLEPGNAVRLMTVHASKGLEFPLVVLADASWERGARGGSTLLVDPAYGLSCKVYSAESNKFESGFAHRRNLKLQALKEEAERKRLLYVAATRAQDYLLVSGSIRWNKRGDLRLRGWLKLLLPALGISCDAREPRQVLPFGGHSLTLLMPQEPPPRQLLRHSASNPNTLWEREADRADDPPLMPPLLTPLPRDRSIRRLPHISATQLAPPGDRPQASNTGTTDEPDRSFREIAMTGPPDDDYDKTFARRAPIARLIGRIAHEVLRYSDFAGEETVSDELIGAIAWEQGLTNAARLRSALPQIGRLLQEYRRSDVYRWLASARAAGRPVYTELPFVFRSHAGVVHGVIDVLLQQQDREWVIVDYKTGEVPAGDFRGRAARFLPQLGVYAAAVKARFRLERLPRAYIHYLRGNQLIELAREDCQRELNRLAETIGAVVAYDEQT